MGWFIKPLKRGINWFIGQFDGNHITWLRPIIHHLGVLIPLWLGVELQDEWLVTWALCLNIINELMDALDGSVSRHNKTTSTSGKMADPWVDAYCRCSLFGMFMYLGWMPFWKLMVIFSRDLFNMWIRMDLASIAIQFGLKEDDIGLGALWTGKVKAWVQGFMQCSVIHLYRHEDYRLFDFIWQDIMQMKEWNRPQAVSYLLWFATLFTAYSCFQYVGAWIRKRKELLRNNC